MCVHRISFCSGIHIYTIYIYIDAQTWYTHTVPQASSGKITQPKDSCIQLIMEEWKPDVFFSVSWVKGTRLYTCSCGKSTLGEFVSPLRCQPDRIARGNMANASCQMFVSLVPETNISGTNRKQMDFSDRSCLLLEEEATGRIGTAFQNTL